MTMIFRVICKRNDIAKGLSFFIIRMLCDSRNHTTRRPLAELRESHQKCARGAAFPD